MRHWSQGCIRIVALAWIDTMPQHLPDKCRSVDAAPSHGYSRSYPPLLPDSGHSFHSESSTRIFLSEPEGRVSSNP